MTYAAHDVTVRSKLSFELKEARSLLTLAINDTRPEATWYVTISALLGGVLHEVGRILVFPAASGRARVFAQSCVPGAEGWAIDVEATNPAPVADATATVTASLSDGVAGWTGAAAWPLFPYATYG